MATVCVEGRRVRLIYAKSIYIDLSCQALSVVCITSKAVPGLWRLLAWDSLAASEFAALCHSLQ
jgi:hypothetical protein